MKNQETKRKILDDYRKELESKINSISLDFANDCYIESDSYISDAFTEFADSMTSIYYYEQKQYFYEHTEQCENDLLELYDSGTLAEIIKKEGLESLICKAGACGEFMENERNLYEDQNEIIKILLVNHVLENMELYEEFTSEQLIEIIEDSDTQDLDQFSDFCDYLAAATYESER